LPDLRFKGLSLSTDRQVYVVNWSSREDRTNSQLTGIATADNWTGYVFGVHVDFDPSLDYAATEADAMAAGDFAKDVPDRKYARLWFQSDVKRARKAAPIPRGTSPAKLRKTVDAIYAEALARDDIEAPAPEEDRKLPDYGMKIRAEYVMFAHFEYLRRMLRGADKLRFYLDPDSGFRAACLAAFHREIRAGNAEAFYVLIAKTMKRTKRERLIAKAWAEFENRLADIHARIAAGEQLEELDQTTIAKEWEAELEPPSEKELTDVFDRRKKLTKKQRRRLRDPGAMKVEAFVRRVMIRARIPKLKPVQPFGDKWLNHPMPRLNEPAKLVCHLTDRGTPPADEKAWDALAHLYDRASLHAVDNFFQVARRSFNLLDRADRTATQGRIHFIYLPFDPAMVIKMLDIHRVVFNYMNVSPEKETTPAMRLGLADRVITEEDILGFPAVAPPMVRTKPVIPRKKDTDDPTAGDAPLRPELDDQIPF
jgi:hypothetical protein